MKKNSEMKSTLTGKHHDQQPAKKTGKKLVPGKHALSAKMLLFIEEWLKDFNGTRAYAKVYGVIEKVASAAAARMLRNVRVQAVIQDRLSKRLMRAEVNAQFVIERLAVIAEASLHPFLKITNDGAATIDLSEATKDQIGALIEYSCEEVIEGAGDNVQRVRRAKIRLKDQLKALELLGRNLQLWNESRQRLNDEARKILKQVRCNEISVEDSAYGFAILELPLPEILRSKLVTLDPPEIGEPLSTERILERKREMEETLENQRKIFLPDRRTKVEELKEQNRGGFDPSLFQE